MRINKGYSLIELVVSMAIFLVIMTIAIGAFVSVSRMKGLTSTMKESQQKTRITMEMITRLSRQAGKVVITNNGKTLDLYFSLKNNPYGTRFHIDDINQELLYSECTGTLTCLSSATEATNLYEGIDLLPNSKFAKDGTIPPTLKVELYGKIGDASTNEYYSDEINLNTTIILEGIK